MTEQALSPEMEEAVRKARTDLHRHFCDCDHPKPCAKTADGMLRSLVLQAQRETWEECAAWLYGRAKTLEGEIDKTPNTFEQDSMIYAVDEIRDAARTLRASGEGK